MLLCSSLGILVVDIGAEDLVLAVFRPGLSNHLKLHIGGVAHACFLPGRKGIGICKIFLERLHLCQVESQKALLRKLLQSRIIHGGQVKVLDSHIAGDYLIRVECRKFFRAPLLPLYELCLLHQRVVEGLLHRCKLVIRKLRSSNQELHCSLDHLSRGKLSAQGCLYRLASCDCCWVCNSRAVGHLHYVLPVRQHRAFCNRAIHGSALSHCISKKESGQLRGKPLDIF